MLHADGISHRFDYPLFDDISLGIAPGESVAILGVSGSGKSTLLNILSSFLKPDHGNVVFNGQSLYELSRKALIALRRRELGIIFQQHYLFRGFTGKENLEVAAMLSGEKLEPTMLEALGIDKVIGQPIGELSGGQQQRVSIARVLTKKPSLIFADEPTGNLDKQTAKEVMGMMFDYLHTRQAGMFLVTHDEALASRCNRTLLLENRILKVI